MLKLFKKSVSEPEEMKAIEPASWFVDNDEDEGHLAIDVYQTPDSLVVKSTIAGAKPENIEVLVTGDMLTIKGERQMQEEVDYNDYLYRECYWGKFSRTVVLPVAVEEKGVAAKLDNGILTVVLPKAKREQEVKIKVKE